MANMLNIDKQIAVIGGLAEGSSIRSIERITGVHRDTILRLGVKVGQSCTALMDAQMRNLTVLHIPPAVTPLMAVRTAIAAEVRNAQA